MLLLAGCSLAGLPSQNKPSCSWDTSPPANHDQVCAAVFSTLSRIVSAGARGDAAAIHRLVPNRTVAGRVIAYSKSRRARGLASMHVDPSLVLTMYDPANVGAGLFVIVKYRSGHQSDPETVYLRHTAHQWLVVNDQPNQDW